MAAKKKPIRVGMDIRDLRVARTGQKTVTQELYRQFSRYNDPELEFVFFDTTGAVYTGTNRWRLRWEHMRYQWWKQVVWPVRAWYKKCDVLFCCDYFTPYLHLGFKTMELFHDAFFFEYPDHYNRPFLKLFRYLAMPAAKRCARIMVTTEYARSRVHELAGLSLHKLVTIPLAPKTMAASSLPAISHPLLPKGRRFILHVGVMEKRKNLPVLIKAFALLTQQGYEDIDLVLVGKGNEKIFSDDAARVHQAVKECNLGDRVVFTGYLSDNDVALFYQHALLYVFPSYNEGFGIPVLEAFRFHVPVIVASNSSLPEVGGDAVRCFDPFDPADICRVMELVIQDDSVRRQMIANGDKRLRDFSWERSAEMLAGVFKDIAREGRSS
jgi:glycosyltransferase involved in cell wall biosynthesis